ncbi:MAG: hypothetical protein H0W50_01510 [Parachlamydiaceae bacterium]|nr:hypothetical protein [Parachlamydiaceae bacterium]
MNISLKESGLDGQLVCDRVTEYEKLLGEKAIKQKLLILKVCDIGWNVLVLSLFPAIGAATFTATYWPFLAISGILVSCVLAARILKPFTGFKEFNSYVTLKEITDNWNSSLGLRKIKMLINEFDYYIEDYNRVTSPQYVSQLGKDWKVTNLNVSSNGYGVAQFLGLTIQNSLARFKSIKNILEQNLQQGA